MLLLFARVQLATAAEDGTCLHPPSAVGGGRTDGLAGLQGDLGSVFSRVDWGRTGKDALAFGKGLLMGAIPAAIGVAVVSGLVATFPAWGTAIMVGAAVVGTAMLAVGAYDTISHWGRYSEQQRFQSAGNWIGGFAGGAMGGNLARGVGWIISRAAGRAGAPAAAAAGRLATATDLAALRGYVKTGWKTLSRDNSGLLAAAMDPKFPTPASGRWPVYVAATENRAMVEAHLQATMPAADFAKIEVKTLPAEGAEAPPGLLYLPHPYVVPGGRFNEMYGWDSYFIQVGLLRDGETQMAQHMADNAVYQVMHYGAVLNANRSYYLTRSQPPALTEMLLGVYSKTQDKQWLASTLPAVEKYYAYWTNEPHLTPSTGLSRYYDTGRGPSFEVLSAEKDLAGKTHYDRVREWFRDHPSEDSSRFYNRSTDSLTDLFYRADGSMRESGFDPSNRFGPFNAGVLDYNPVCLNSFLYRMETEAAMMQRELGNPAEAAVWDARAATRKDAVNRLLWDDKGLYLDYDYQTGTRRDYPFGTTFFPLWAGIASKEQAAAMVDHALPLLEAPGGLQTSLEKTGNQWDSPYGWAPLVLVAAKGLRRYGYDAEADRISAKFLSMVLDQFVERGGIFEKYDALSRGSQVSDGIQFGYSSNEVGFGWTNATFVELLHDLSPAARSQVLMRDGLTAGR